MFKLSATPTVYIGQNVDYADQYFNGSDGKLYDDRDIEWLTKRYGTPRTRKTKYGINYYFDGKEG